MAYIREWAELGDELGQAPDHSQYARRYGCDLPVASTRARLFQQAFPRETDPAQIVDFLKLENPGALFMRTLTMSVVDLRETSHPPVDVFVEGDRGGTWAVWTNERLRSSHRSKAEAVAAARSLAQRMGCSTSRIAPGDLYSEMRSRRRYPDTFGNRCPT